MSWIAVAGVAITAVGAGMSAKGAADSAEAIGEANAENMQQEQELYNRQTKAANQLSNRKQAKLSDLGNIFDRMQSTGAFGDTATLENLRKAQSDYSALAAGDFSGFESQLRQSLSDSLIATAGAGAPIGAFAGLAAQDQLQLRGQGIQTAMGISDYLSTEAYKLLGNEFGIMDQKFEVGYKLDRDKTTNMSQYRLGGAATEGVALASYGQATQQIGSSVVGAYNNYQNRQMVQASNANQLEIAKLAYGNAGRTGNPNVMMGGPSSNSVMGAGMYPSGGYQTPSSYNQSLANSGGAPASNNGVIVSLPGDQPMPMDGTVLPPLPNDAVTSGADPYGNGIRTSSQYRNPYNMGWESGYSGMSLLGSVGADIAMR